MIEDDLAGLGHRPLIDLEEALGDLGTVEESDVFRVVLQKFRDVVSGTDTVGVQGRCHAVLVRLHVGERGDLFIPVVTNTKAGFSG